MSSIFQGTIRKTTLALTNDPRPDKGQDLNVVHKLSFGVKDSESAFISHWASFFLSRKVRDTFSYTNAIKRKRISQEEGKGLF